MQVHQIFVGNSLRNFTYILEDDDKLFCIDPFDAKIVLELIEKINKPLIAVINTHEHYDHTKGNDDLVQRTRCEIWAHYNAKEKIKNISKFMKAGDKISLSSGCLEVMDTPGHTFSHLCLLERDQKGKALSIFTGDTLFNAGVGNCHNGGEPRELFKTIHTQFQELEDDVIVYPGHEYLGNNLRFTLSIEPDNKPAKELLDLYQRKIEMAEYLKTDMQKEREINTFLRLDNGQFVEGIREDSLEDTFVNIRSLRNNW